MTDMQARGWVFAQRMADASRAAASSHVEPDVDDEALVDAPDPSLWLALE